MSDAKRTEIDVEDLMNRIHRDIKPGKDFRGFSENSTSFSIREISNEHIPDSISLSRMPEDSCSLPHRKEYAIKDFLDFHDEAFIRNAYRGILRRAPDDSGFSHFLNALRETRYTKIEILGRLRFSYEGRMQSVRIKGLMAPLVFRMACRIPIFGYLLTFIIYLVRLPVVVKNWERHEAVSHRKHTEFRSWVNSLACELESVYKNMSFRIDNSIQLLSVLRHEMLSLDEFESRMKVFDREIGQKANLDQIEIFNDKFQVVEKDLQESKRQLWDHKINILDQHRRFSLLLTEARKRLPEPFSTEQLQKIVSEESHLLDAYYTCFEDRFRGTREEIKKRLEIYLQKFKEAHAGTPDATILDVGCGRGELLELLQSHHLVAYGVDLNRTMVDLCRERGLNVQEGDAIACLREIQTNTLGAVTGIHIIEHLPLDLLISLFDETLRVLRPGGIVIFETPNPENIRVGACNFYYDPTHRNPLPPIPMQFLLEARGFSRVEILRIKRHNPSEELNEGSERIREIMNAAFFAAQDYALIGYKA